jgi:hypothetical protein
VLSDDVAIRKLSGGGTNVRRTIGKSHGQLCGAMTTVQYIQETSNARVNRRWYASLQSFRNQSGSINFLIQRRFLVCSFLEYLLLEAIRKYQARRAIYVEPRTKGERSAGNLVGCGKVLKDLYNEKYQPILQLSSHTFYVYNSTFIFSEREVKSLLPEPDHHHCRA